MRGIFPVCCASDAQSTRAKSMAHRAKTMAFLIAQWLSLISDF